jgi:hypothetical protein
MTAPPPRTGPPSLPASARDARSRSATPRLTIASPIDDCCVHNNRFCGADAPHTAPGARPSGPSSCGFAGNPWHRRFRRPLAGTQCPGRRVQKPREAFAAAGYGRIEPHD